MRVRARAGSAGAVTLAIAAALLAAPLDSEAKGSSGSGSSSAGSSKSTAAPEQEGATRTGTHLTIRPGGAPRASARQDATPVPAGRVRAVLPGPATASEAPADAEAQARPAAEPPAVAKTQAPPLPQPTAEERAEAARVAAVDERKKRERTSLQAEVDEVLERARNDYPVLRTEAGEPILRSILARQKVLQKGGLYPSIAMVEAVADHSDTLRPRPRPEPLPQQAEATLDYSKTYGSCRWVDPYTWSCK